MLAQRLSRKAGNRPVVRAGFTLIEMLLVLAVLLAAAAMVSPSIRMLYREQQMSKVIETVQVKLAAAKMRAIREDLNYHFRFEPEGQRFIVVPELAVGPAGAEQAETAQPAETRAPWSFSGTLPDGMKFAPGDWQTTAGGEIPAASFQGLADAAALGSATWSQPLIFHPDSTSTGGTIAVYDTNGLQVRFMVRDVTAGVTVSPIERRE